MDFYSRLREQQNYDETLRACIERVVDKLETAKDPLEPGMLLGKIQSGKTRAFLGVIARAFDRDFDIAIVLTKGTRTLAKQTVKRIGRDFKSFVDDDQVLIFDIMSAPDGLAKTELRRKIIIVAKKQADNLKRILEFFDQKYPQLKERRALLIDDEADMASVRFTKEKGKDTYDQGTIAKQMDELRGALPGISFLQVTATPYALYLQPGNYEQAKLAREVFYPKRPAFTEILPTHDAYVGGEDYFGGWGADDPRYYLHVEVGPHEHDALRSTDGRTIRADRIWTSDNIKALRRAIMGFLVGVAIRERQLRAEGARPRKFSMIIHNDTQKARHAWQNATVQLIAEAFTQAEASGDARLRKVFDEAYRDLGQSVEANGDPLAAAEDCFADVRGLISDGELRFQLVNSDAQLEPLLDPDSGELHLRTKANIFIGGSILDRGITVPNLIAFYYGRNPKRMQADTVLQHARMYGARPRADLAVTRFYTSSEVHGRLVTIHKLEKTLRDAFEKGAHDAGVVFIQADDKKSVVPCAPSKVTLSDVVAIGPSDALLPHRFNTIAATKLTKVTQAADKLVPAEALDSRGFAAIGLDEAIAILDALEPALDLGDDNRFEWDAMRGLLKYYARDHKRVAILAATGRRLHKSRSEDHSGLSILGSPELRDLIRQKGRVEPALVLLKQVGGPELGWKAGPFWWPILFAPSEGASCVYATKVAA
ncbi:Z1 domain-containing protein [Caulobacter sp. UNC279MFTsu5.1]|uniref:Z1 domain-containing protein n=1 Tax=Caulobacter sp. UNC279MFTsu5.1 TaxID=1502775 RepID=UPI0008EA9E3F|nr:Z1 domain-containing protein [Caulobacter sp. UNC279MFTsu5.1]SFI52732.1 Z1 domain-containing protein [Caulobacter sp. UNC279MFTsu5.1]